MLFMIGNGFDLALGLKTSYKDFVNWYIDQPDPNDDKIIKFKEQIKEDIKNDIHSWSDLEMKLGEYTQNYDKAEDFIHISRALKLKLNDYYKNQEAEIAPSKVPNIITGMSDFLTKFHHKLSAQDKIYITNSEIPCINKNNVILNFITFNYTHTLERCLELLPFPLHREKRDGSKYECKLGTTLHIHGKIGKFPLVGVNSKEQIHNIKFQEDERVLQNLVKPEQNKQLKNNSQLSACRLISSTVKTICLFGLSIGESDIIWWENIGTWLLCKNKGYRKLVIFSHLEKPCPNVNPDELLEEENKVKNRFIKMANIKDEHHSKALMQIIVCFNPSFFNFKLS